MMTMHDEHGNGNGGAALARVQHGSGQLAASETAMGDRSIAKTSAHTHAMTVRQEAEIKAQYTMALARPRDLDTVRLKLMKRCESKRFADVARYSKPQGRKKNEVTQQWEQNYVEGWSIRFVEEAIRTMGNIKPETRVTADDAERRMVWVCVTDMEANIPYAAEITINKTVERKELKKNQMPLAVRTNSYGDPVYILPATDDEVRMAEARLVSMTLRTLGLRLVPGDILDEALEIVERVRRSDIDADPTAARKKIVDSFAGIGVRPVDLVEYLGGRPLDALTPDLILELRGVFQMVREEGTRWQDVLASSPYIEREEGEEPAKGGAAAKLRERLDAKTQELGEKEKVARAAREKIETIAREVGVNVRSVQATLQLVRANKSVADIARYCREQTGIEDEVVVGEIVARATKAGLIADQPAPAAAPAPAPQPEKKTRTAAPKTAPTTPAPAPASKDHKAIAEECGVSPELVAAIAPFASGGDSEGAVTAALHLQGRSVDEPTVALVLAALRK